MPLSIYNIKRDEIRYEHVSLKRNLCYKFIYTNIFTLYSLFFINSLLTGILISKHIESLKALNYCSTELFILF